MLKPCGHVPSNPAKCSKLMVPWQIVPLPVGLHVYQDGGGGLRLVSAAAGAAVAASPAAAIASAQRPRVAVTLIMSPPWLGNPPGVSRRLGLRSCLAFVVVGAGSWVSPGEGAVPEAVAAGALVVVDGPDDERAAGAESTVGCVREVGYLVADDQPPAGLKAHLGDGQIVGGGGVGVAGYAVGADPHLPGSSRQRDAVRRVAEALGAGGLGRCDVPGPAAEHLMWNTWRLRRYHGCCGSGQVAAVDERDVDGEDVRARPQGAGQQQIPPPDEQVGGLSREVLELVIDEEAHRCDAARVYARHAGLPANGPGELGPVRDRRARPRLRGRRGC